MKESYPETFFLVHSALASEHAMSLRRPLGRVLPVHVLFHGVRNCSLEAVGRSLSVVFIARAGSTQGLRLRVAPV